MKHSLGLITLLVVAFVATTVTAQGFGPGAGNGVCSFIDENGDGFNDLAPDADGDGIPNGLDPDYTRPLDGSGQQHQYGHLVLVGPMGGAMIMFGPAFGGPGDQGQFGQAQGAGAMHAWGPGDGTGTGVGPQDGTGFGPGGSGDCDGTGTATNMQQRSQRRGGH